MKQYDDLQKVLIPIVGKLVFDFINKHVDNNHDKTNFLFLVYINLLGNTIIQSSKPDILAENFEAIKKAVSFSFDELLKQVENEGKEELQ